MPELPDIVVYIEALKPRMVGHRLRHIRIRHPFLLRSVALAPSEVEGREVQKIRRIGKRIAIGLEGDAWLVLHLMIAGRLHWRDADLQMRRKADLASFDFDKGCLLLTETGTQKRASLYIVEGDAGLAAHDPGGLEVLGADFDSFRRQLRLRNHTLKRALTDPRLFSGIGNAYSDEILHRARLSPVSLTQKIDDEEILRLYESTRATLEEWLDRLHKEAHGEFPEKVTAFREGMAVHGRFGQACPDCGVLVQRIRYAANETNYCPRCQTGGRILADRALSRLLKEDWPRTIEEWEALLA